MRRAQAQHAPAAMTRAYNRTMAFAKIDTGVIEKLDDRMIESIARAHKVPVVDLFQRLAARKEREAAHG